MGWFSSNDEKKEKSANIKWKNLTELAELNNILEDRSGQKNILFKHSTRCGISTMVKRQFENEWPENRDDISVWLLDLLIYRNISNAIAEKTGVAHQSPQVIAFLNGEVVYADSHNEINAGNSIKNLVK